MPGSFLVYSPLNGLFVNHFMACAKICGATTSLPTCVNTAQLQAMALGDLKCRLPPSISRQSVNNERLLNAGISLRYDVLKSEDRVNQPGVM